MAAAASRSPRARRAASSTTGSRSCRAVPESAATMDVWERVARTAASLPGRASSSVQICRQGRTDLPIDDEATGFSMTSCGSCLRAVARCPPGARPAKPRPPRPAAADRAASPPGRGARASAGTPRSAGGADARRSRGMARVRRVAQAAADAAQLAARRSSSRRGNAVRSRGRPPQAPDRQGYSDKLKTAARPGHQAASGC